MVTTRDSHARAAKAPHRSTVRTLARAPRVRAAAALLLAIAAGLVTWLAVHSGNSGPKSAPIVTASEQTLRALPATLGHPVYWAGAQHGTTYELTRTSDGRIYIRYLPLGVEKGAKHAYLTVGTYPIKNPLVAVKAMARRTGSRTISLPGGGIAAQDMHHPTSVYAAYPGVRYEVELYDPSASQALELVESGRISALAADSDASAAASVHAHAATVQELQQIVTTAGHPVYWTGARAAAKYEATQTADGRIYVRYLPVGVEPGSKHPYTTIGTYPVKSAAAAVAAVAKRTGSATFSVAGGGVAAVNGDHPTSVYVAFPNSAYEIEVFDPSPAHARALVESGQLAQIR